MAIPAIRRFGRGDRLHVQAQRIWMILAGHVSGSGERRRRGELTLTYGELALRMGYDDTRAGHMLSRQLGIVGEYCLLNDLPALNAIVVNSKTGVAGEDVGPGDVEMVVERVAGLIGKLVEYAPQRENGRPGVDLCTIDFDPPRLASEALFLLDQRHPHALRCQRKRCGKSAHAAPDNRYVEIAVH